ncbi:MAG: guanylate kinase [Patescibacteria group bacterium]|jgi:guanylate kinase
MKSEKIIAIITGPSAVGKTTIAKEVLRRLKSFKASTTYTTRPKRDKDTEDKIMYYVSETEFRSMIDDDQFIEWAQVHDNFYGTSKKALEETLKTHNVLMNIDVQGAKIIKKKFAKHISIFILPEHIEDIASRIQQRDMTKIMKNLRIENAKLEMSQADHFDYKIVNYNNKIELAIEKIVKILAKY